MSDKEYLATFLCPASVEYVCNVSQPYEVEVQTVEVNKETIWEVRGFSKQVCGCLHGWHWPREDIEPCLPLSNTPCKDPEHLRLVHVEPKGGKFKHSHEGEARCLQVLQSVGVEKRERNEEIALGGKSAATLSNRLVFRWCNGSIGTIEDMLEAPFKSVVDLTNASRERTDSMMGKDRLERHDEGCRREARLHGTAPALTH